MKHNKLLFQAVLVVVCTVTATAVVSHYVNPVAGFLVGVLAVLGSDYAQLNPLTLYLEWRKLNEKIK